MMEAVTSKKFENEIEEIKELFKYRELNAGSITMLLMKVMSATDKCKKLSELQKKNLIIKTVNKLIEDIVPGEDVPIELILKQMVPDLIDNVYEYTRVKKCLPKCI